MLLVFDRLLRLLYPLARRIMPTLVEVNLRWCNRIVRLTHPRFGQARRDGNERTVNLKDRRFVTVPGPPSGRSDTAYFFTS
jgi:hypothetical protein